MLHGGRKWKEMEIFVYGLERLWKEMEIEIRMDYSIFDTIKFGRSVR